ncbi:hypothetical protein L596_017396 [Steinernema carpocapsae]|uniref:Multifunctional methyltransferase subunit TRM112-like protein n=1 Tax=Steinernema carpocapsae TaxID=34508 RepID=A0A4U5N1J1_STECR|nr:hypothetical protein L596_017396 [Steinernema carpocapsae]
MKLLTHNFMCSNFLKNVTTGYPLILRATKLEGPKDWNATPEFFEKILPRVDYTVLYKTVQDLKEHPEAGYTFEHFQHLPVPVAKEWQTVNLADDANDNILKAVTEALGVEVVEGELQCPESNRIFTISNGIPNMLANEDEVA